MGRKKINGEFQKLGFSPLYLELISKNKEEKSKLAPNPEPNGQSWNWISTKTNLKKNKIAYFELKG